MTTGLKTLNEGDLEDQLNSVLGEGVWCIVTVLPAGVCISVYAWGADHQLSLIHEKVYGHDLLGDSIETAVNFIKIDFLFS